MIELLLGIAGGLVAGIALTRIAPEELVPGKKYFEFFQKILSLALFILAAIYLIRSKEAVWLGFFCLAFMLLSLVALRKKQQRWQRQVLHQGLFYGIVAMPYVLVSDQQFRVLISVLLFLYGMPTGTLLSMNIKKDG